LIQATGNRAVPAVWLVFSAICGLVATIMLGWRERAPARAATTAAAVELPEWSRSDVRESI
jgi:hypothetical protein